MIATEELTAEVLGSSDIEQSVGARVPKATGATSETALKVALIHDWLTGMRGGEKVLEMLCRRFPGAPIWTLLHLPGKVSPTIEGRPIHTSLLQAMPYASKRYRSYLPLFPLFAELHKVREADLVISSSHAVAKAMIGGGMRGSRPFHICYIHTPMRYVWDMFDEYFGPERVGAFASNWFFRPIARALQAYDRYTVRRVDLFLANSTYVAERVRRIYGRQAEVLPPPVDTERFLHLERAPEDWYLIVSALVPYKRVDMAIRACHAMGRRLKLVGTGPETAALKKLAGELGADVDFVGYASEQELGDYYRRARALLFPGVEDFGIVPVEAISCGCPVVSLGVGGILDSMTEATGVFYQGPTVEGLLGGMREFEQREPTFSTDALRARAMHFSQNNFLDRLDVIVEQSMRAIATEPAIGLLTPADA